MKMSILLIGIIFNSVTFGCPEIQGIYSAEGATTIFETSNQDGIFTYIISGDLFVADAKSHQKTAEGMVMNYSANCHGNKLFFNSTIFQKDKQRVQVGSGVFSKIDNETVHYDYTVTLYSSTGDIINALPDVHIVFKLQSPPK
ncbi:MAG: hypothetical protein ACAH59_14105 [Pseudobdellovibrionaceae bacterium]